MNRETFEKAMQAALTGPEVKKIKFEKHEFNVKPVKVERAGDVRVRGQISHHLRFRDDDQVFYAFTLRPGQAVSITDVDLDIERSVMSRVLTFVWDEILKEVLAELLADQVQRPGEQQSELSGAQQAADRVFEESKTLLDGSWEGETRFLIVNIAARVGMGVAATTGSGGDPLTVARRLGGRRVRVGTVRDHRT